MTARNGSLNLLPRRDAAFSDEQLPQKRQKKSDRRSQSSPFIRGVALVLFSWLSLLLLSCWFPTMFEVVSILGIYTLSALLVGYFVNELCDRVYALIPRNKLWLATGTIFGILLFAWITKPAFAIMEPAERYTNEIFGTFLDESWTKLFWGGLRLVGYVSVVVIFFTMFREDERGGSWIGWMWAALKALLTIGVLEGFAQLFFNAGGTAAGR